MLFRDRAEAGRLLARKLEGHAGEPGVLVLALSGGGAVTALEVALGLALPLDLLLVRRLALPGSRELAMGAVSNLGAAILNRELVNRFGVPPGAVERSIAREEAELRRKERALRGARPPLEVRGRTVLLVDDGLTAVSTLRAAVRVLRKEGAGAVVAATAMASASAQERLEGEVDRLVALVVSAAPRAAPHGYRDRPPAGDGEVHSLLERAACTAGAPGGDAAPEEMGARSLEEGSER
jgi:putative phosphoribosyl transferase